jgi:DNA-binding transcriptional LysR family regulator
MTPRGVLHLAAPVSFDITQLGPALADYLSRYREVVVDVTLSMSAVRDNADSDR